MAAAAASAAGASLCFRYRADLSDLPAALQPFEVDLHGGFAVDAESGTAFYGLPGLGLIRIAPDLRSHDVIALPSELGSLNFHATVLIELAGERRLVLPANRAAQVVIVDLEGRVDGILPTPEFEEYATAEFKPTSATAHGDELVVADGYGANYISTADLRTAIWSRFFGGKSDDRDDRRRFGTAHGISASPTGEHLVVVDRSLDRIVTVGWDGQFVDQTLFPAGTRPCGIDFLRDGEGWLAAVACLADPAGDRDAPVLILDGESYEVRAEVRPAEELAVRDAHRLHHAAWHRTELGTFLLVQAWNPGRYFVLELTAER